MKKTTLFLVVALAAMVSLHAQTVPDGLLYANEGAGIKITGYTGTATLLVIPNSIGGRSVTVIGQRAFWNNYTLQGVTLPNTVTTIERGAFQNCAALQSVNMPTALTTIMNSAFDHCRSLVGSITLPASLRTIGNEAFMETGLTSVTFNNGLLTIGEGAFYGVSFTGNITIPASVTSIGAEAFSAARPVTISRSTQLGANAFPAGATITYR